MGQQNDFKEGISAYLSTVAATLAQVNNADLDSAINVLIEAYKRGSSIYCFGNGGSAATASHMLNDFNKGISCKLNKKFNFYCLNDNVAILTALANDVGYSFVFSKQLEGRLLADDLIIAISGSGNSANVIQAVEYAHACGCKVIGMTGYDGGRLGQIADYHMHVPSYDIKIVEDVHMIFNHMMVKLLCQALSDVDHDRHGGENI